MLQQQGAEETTRKQLLQEEYVYVSVPAAPGAAPSHQVALLNFAAAKDNMWMEVKVANLKWLRGFIREELKATGQAAVSKGPGAAAASSDTSPRKKAIWCSDASCWRVRYWGGNEWLVKNMFVARKPRDTFQARCVQVEFEAIDFFDQHHQEGAR